MKLVYEIIQQLRNTSSTKEKQKILEENKNFRDLEKYLYFVYAKADLKYYFKRKLKKTFEYNQRTLDIIDIEKIVEDLSKRKYTGNDAIEYIQNITNEICPMSMDMLQCLFDRDIRAGVNVSIINKVYPGLIKDLPYNRCSLYQDKFISDSEWNRGIFSQEKMDGSYASIEIADNIEVITRQSMTYNNESLGDVIKELETIQTKNIVLNGEFLVFEDEILLPREVSNGILNTILKGGNLKENQKIHYYVWDVIPIENFFPKCKWKVPYSERWDTISTLITDDFKYIHLVENKIVYSKDEAMEHYKQIVSSGGEGTVVKLANSIFQDGTNKSMFKLKVEVECELQVIGYTEGKGKNSNTFGSLICKSSDDKVRVNVAGIKYDIQKEIIDNIQDWIDCVITVRYNAINKPTNGVWTLNLPRFVERRFDKIEADSLEKIIEIYNSKI